MATRNAPFRVLDGPFSPEDVPSWVAIGAFRTRNGALAVPNGPFRVENETFRVGNKAFGRLNEERKGEEELPGALRLTPALVDGERGEETPSAGMSSPVRLNSAQRAGRA